MKCIINAKLIVGDEIIEGKILYFDNKIVKINDRLDENILEVIDAKNNYVSAGFIDIHIHGSGGADVMDASFEALETLSTAIIKTGTTSFLATTMTMSPKEIDNALHCVQKFHTSVTGASILGVHLEGPFINSDKHGAQDKTHIQSPNFTLIENYMDIVKMITLAPEVENSKDFIKFITKKYPHVLMSIGHSDATYKESKESFTWGVSHATHLFNAMNPYHHRKPGIVGAVFDSDVTCDIIADLVHTHSSVLELVQKNKKDKLILITDAMRAGCMKCGSYDLGGRNVEVSEGKAVLEDGTLAGSVLQMNEALNNMKKHTSMNIVEIVKAVTSTPAQKLGIKKGVLKEGYDADIVIFDESFSIMTSIVNGIEKYKR
ncbi:MAG: N-acetylglucosamine-6-phosphate deacetylase [Sulfurovum sp.]|nr:N-acetylglucosamine-6-phosphate deacetylase [Sulfurovum sp.]